MTDPIVATSEKFKKYDMMIPLSDDHRDTILTFVKTIDPSDLYTNPSVNNDIAIPTEHRVIAAQNLSAVPSKGYVDEIEEDANPIELSMGKPFCLRIRNNASELLNHDVLCVNFKSDTLEACLERLYEDVTTTGRVDPPYAIVAYLKEDTVEKYIRLWEQADRLNPQDKEVHIKELTVVDSDTKQKVLSIRPGATADSVPTSSASETENKDGETLEKNADVSEQENKTIVGIVKEYQSSEEDEKKSESCQRKRKRSTDCEQSPSVASSYPPLSQYDCGELNKEDSDTNNDGDEKSCAKKHCTPVEELL